MTTNTTRSAWVRVTRRNPCPICRKPDWCGITSDGTVVHCQRIESDRPSRGKSGGWIHRLDGAYQVRADRPIRDHQPTRATPINFDRWIDQARANTTVEQLDAIAGELGVSTESLDALGWARCHDLAAWAIPMRKPDGSPCGIRLRGDNGRKWAVTGSKAGLFFDPLTITPTNRTLLVLEGPTDTAAMLTLGYTAIGRHACHGQHDEVAEFCRLYKISRVIIWADNDDPKNMPDGTTTRPGLDGAKALRDALAKRYWTKLCLPPHKDMRQWLRGGASKVLVDAVEREHIWRRPNA